MIKNRYGQTPGDVVCKDGNKSARSRIEQLLKGMATILGISLVFVRSVSCRFVDFRARNLLCSSVAIRGQLHPTSAVQPMYITRAQ